MYVHVYVFAKCLIRAPCMGLKQRRFVLPACSGSDLQRGVLSSPSSNKLCNLSGKPLRDSMPLPEKGESSFPACPPTAVYSEDHSNSVLRVLCNPWSGMHILQLCSDCHVESHQQESQEACLDTGQSGVKMPFH